MIYDDLTHAATYRHLHPGIARALDYLRQTNFADVSNGKYELDGSQVYALVQRYQTRLPQDAGWESHRKYIDVQYVFQGQERFGYVPLNQAPAVITPYNEEKDVIFYAPGTVTLPLSTGQFAIYFPQDVHAPSLAEGGTPTDVIKVVVKVAV